MLYGRGKRLIQIFDHPWNFVEDSENGQTSVVENGEQSVGVYVVERKMPNGKEVDMANVRMKGVVAYAHYLTMRGSSSSKVSIFRCSISLFPLLDPFVR
jgi:hypothetical protein